MTTDTAFKRKLIREQIIKHADTYEKALLMRHKIHKSKKHEVTIVKLNNTIKDDSLQIAKLYSKTFKINDNSTISINTEITVKGCNP